jgi:HD superfamily phosphohydrolase
MIELSRAEWAAVDTPVFQRLRRVRQLAMTYLVYPGTLHTRFEHSIGVRHIAGHLSASLELSEEDREIVQVAVLLHDVGHGVFSHVSEQVIDELSGADGVHEAVSVAIMRTDESLHRALGRELCERAAEIVGLEGPRSVMRDIVSGPTDADKLDYLLRDSHYAGVNYGRYDLDRIIDTARVIAPTSAQTQLGFDADGLWAVEEMRLARHHMHRQVYGHKTRLATDIWRRGRCGWRSPRACSRRRRSRSPWWMAAPGSTMRSLPRTFSTPMLGCWTCCAPLRRGRRSATSASGCAIVACYARP